MSDHEHTPDDTPGRAVVRRKTRTERLLEAQQILELHVAGIEDVYICERFKISRSTLFRRIREALAAVIDPTVDEYRAEAQARIRASRRRIHEELTRQRQVGYTLDGDVMILNAAGPAEVAALVGRLSQLEELEARLRGGFAPTRVDVRHKTESAFETLEAELAAMTEQVQQEDEGQHAEQ